MHGQNISYIPPQQPNSEPQKKEKEIEELDEEVDEYGNPILPEEPIEEEAKIIKEETKVINEPVGTK